MTLEWLLILRIQRGFILIFHRDFFALRHPVGGILFHPHLPEINIFQLFVRTTPIICEILFIVMFYMYVLLYKYGFILCTWSYVYCSGVEEWCLPSIEVEINQSIAINSVGDCSERTVLGFRSSLLVIIIIIIIIVTGSAKTLHVSVFYIPSHK